MPQRVAVQEGMASLLLRLRAEGIASAALLNAVEQTPRSEFVLSQFQADAYSSRTLPLDCGAFMEGLDFTVKLLNALNLKPGQRVLEVGTAAASPPRSWRASSSAC